MVLPSTRGRHALLPSGVSNYIVKPVSRKELARNIQKLELEQARILLVDDDPAMVRFVEQALKSDTTSITFNGFEILTAYSGMEALQAVQDHPPDAILLDLDLPDMSGWDVLAEMLRRQGKNIPQVIIISAHDLPQTLFGSGQEVFDITMHRPLSQQELPELLKSMVA